MAEFNDEEYAILAKLMGLSKEYLTFEYDGLLVDGYYVDIIKRYIRLNPSSKFRNWLIDNGLVLKEL